MAKKFFFKYIFLVTSHLLAMKRWMMMKAFSGDES